MAHYSEEVDPAFRGAGANPGLEIWCIENLRLALVPKSSYGKFFSGSAYLVLNTLLLRSGSPQHEIHYWLGRDAKEVDANLVSDKALELDLALGSHAVQYREVQGEETEKFLSYFKPCIIPLEGIFSSGQANVDSNAYRISLLTCKGDRVVHVKEVPFTRSSLNHNDVFILDTASKIFLFSGCNSSTQERAKALEVVQYIKENKHSGKCDIATIEDGKFVADPDVGEFWSLFGGYAPIPKELPSNNQQLAEILATKLFWITTQGKLNQNASGLLTKEMLSSDKCYMLDCEAELYVWMGRGTTITERKTSISAAEEFLRSQGRSHETKLTFLTEGSETDSFRSYFNDWPKHVEQKLYEEGRGKVAAIFKHQGYDVKELPDEDEEDLVFLDLSGETKVWGVDGDNSNSLPLEEPMRFYSGDCYIIQYTYLHRGREENLFYAWLGQNSLKEDRLQAISFMNDLATSVKGDPSIAKIVEGSEPPQFFLILKTLIVFKVVSRNFLFQCIWGKGTRYKTLLAEKGNTDETYDDSKPALFQVQGSSSSNMQAIQVDQVSSSLNSSHCYILKTETSVYNWIGNLTSVRDLDLIDRMLNLMNPTWQAALVREGNEPEYFWTALGGKAEYYREKKVKEFREDPHLFVVSSYEVDLKVKEIFNFSQDDLTTEDVLILDCHSEVFVWVGRHSSVESKHQALDLGVKFVEKGGSLGRLPSEIPVYVVAEGCEPPFFTCFFEWDPSKANMLGNSFERKLAILKGKTQKLEVTLRSSWKAYSIENGSADSKSQSNGRNGRRQSSSPVSSFSGLNLKYSDVRRLSSPPSVTTNFLPGSPDQNAAGSADGVSKLSPQSTGPSSLDENESDANLVVHPYDRLVVVSNNPVTDIDITRREVPLYIYLIQILVIAI
ncbi:OLC1v1006207C1 [Oldenlandia corymbosa var. corymbosa]|uniref:OLC1v1006207C1 n=1 Tax=Oldenlandia corymbosa var. corymbosa TaxID=529605 RepID=A0AAV1DGS5_OLDCO|nr:OLC1v1006207C1 [Oldenlandia corymbosa var. corymbosa]